MYTALLTDSAVLYVFSSSFINLLQLENILAVPIVLTEWIIGLIVCLEKSERRHNAMVRFLRAASEGRWPRICNER